MGTRLNCLAAHNLCFEQKNIIFFIWKFSFLVVKFSIYLNRCVFVMKFLSRCNDQAYEFPRAWFCFETQLPVLVLISMYLKCSRLTETETMFKLHFWIESHWSKWNLMLKSQLFCFLKFTSFTIHRWYFWESIYNSSLYLSYIFIKSVWLPCWHI